MSEEEMKNIANNILKFRQIGLIEATDTFYDTIQEMLNYIDKLQNNYDKLFQGYNKRVQEIILKEKVIDLMAEDIFDNDNFWKIKCRVERIEKGKEKDYIKERFFKKVEEEND